MNQKGFVPVLIVLLIAVGIGGYFLYTNYKSSVFDRTNNQYKSSTQGDSSIPVDETANWKIYTNTKYGFSFKYPSNLKLAFSDDLFSLKTESGTEIIKGLVTNSQSAFVNDLQYEPCEKNSNAKVCINDYEKVNLGIIPAKMFNYIEIGVGGDSYTVLQTTKDPLIQFKLNLAIGDENGLFILYKILPTFKFIQ